MTSWKKSLPISSKFGISINCTRKNSRRNKVYFILQLLLCKIIILYYSRINKIVCTLYEFCKKNLLRKCHCRGLKIEKYFLFCYNSVGLSDYVINSTWYVVDYDVSHNKPTYSEILYISKLDHRTGSATNLYTIDVGSTRDNFGNFRDVLYCPTYHGRMISRNGKF